jgi:hypothetical protein
LIEVLAVISVVLVLAIVVIVAYHLIGIYLALKRSADHLDKLAGGLVKVRDDTRELNAKVGTINQGLSGLLAPLLSANKNLGGIVTLATSASRSS